MRLRMPPPQHGIFVVLFAVLALVLLSFTALALDAAQLYRRHAALKRTADAAALAAARELDGSQAGLEAAATAAQTVLEEQDLIWSASALRFAISADGEWRAAVPPDELWRTRFARIDASELDPGMATMTRMLALGGVAREVALEAVAVAGPTLVQMMPLAICAMDSLRYSERPLADSTAAPERVEHGFRRGVTYNLLRLNPDGTDAVNFVVNPVDVPGAAAVPAESNFTRAVVGPYICSGAMMPPRNGKLFVRQPFPTDLIPEINARLNLYPEGSTCVLAGAPPDANVYEFLLPSWMNNNYIDDDISKPRTQAHAEEWNGGGYLATVADIDLDAFPLERDNLVRHRYGALWAYGRPYHYSSSAADNQGAQASPSAMKNLYPVKVTAPMKDVVSTWATNRTPPYIYAGTATTFKAPVSTRKLRYQRVLHVPLLQCPVVGNEATVLAVGKFMLTVPASNVAGNTYIAAEFGGLMAGSGRSISTRLYR